MSFASTASTPVQSFDMQVPMAPTPFMIDGHRQLSYELHLTNFATHALAISSIDVLDQRTGHRVVASFHDGALASLVGHPGRSDAPNDPRVIETGERAVIYLDIPVADGVRVPTGLLHRIVYDAQASASHEQAIVEGAATSVRATRVPELGPPLRGGPWIAIHEDAMPRGHRRVLFAIDGQVRIPARFAIDWMKLDRDGHYAAGDETQVANWYGYGEDVLAVAAGTVTNVRDGIGESATLSDDRHPLGEASGNFVTLAIGSGTYAHYEHLKPGSIRVKKGEHVTAGQVVGALGYTGDSTGPHLHFHVSTGDAPLEGEGLPHALRTFEVAGVYPSIEAFAERKPWQPAAAGSGGIRRGEFPAANVVVEFGHGHEQPSARDSR